MEHQLDYLSPESVKCKKLNELCSAENVNGQNACVNKIIGKYWPRLGVAESDFSKVKTCPLLEIEHLSAADFTCPAGTADQQYKKTENYTIEGHTTGFQDGSDVQTNFTFENCTAECSKVDSCYAAVYENFYDDTDKTIAPIFQASKGTCYLKRRNFQMLYQLDPKEYGKVKANSDVYEKIVLNLNQIGGQFGNDDKLCSWV